MGHSMQDLCLELEYFLSGRGLYFRAVGVATHVFCMVAHSIDLVGRWGSVY